MHGGLRAKLIEALSWVVRRWMKCWLFERGQTLAWSLGMVWVFAVFVHAWQAHRALTADARRAWVCIGEASSRVSVRLRSRRVRGQASRYVRLGVLSLTTWQKRLFRSRSVVLGGVDGKLSACKRVWFLCSVARRESVWSESSVCDAVTIQALGPEAREPRQRM